MGPRPVAALIMTDRRDAREIMNTVGSDRGLLINTPNRVHKTVSLKWFNSVFEVYNITAVISEVIS